MAKDPAVLWYTSDFIIGTMGMTKAEIGKYVLLLAYQHQKGHLSEDFMIEICGTYEKNVFNKFVKDEQGLYFNERMEAEIIKRRLYSKSRSKNRNSIKKQDIKGNICGTYDSTYVKHMENENEDVNKDVIITKEENKKIIEYDNDFIEFWKIYDMDIQQDECFNQWQYIDVMNRTLILKRVQNYIDNTDKNFRKEPLKYLRNRMWLDEVVKRKSGKQTTQRNNLQTFENPNPF